MDLGERLRADVPALEPDPVLLAQLVQLSTAAAQAPAPRRGHGFRAALMAAGAAGIVSGTAWLAGALPGTASPWHPSHHDHPLPSQHSSQPVPRHVSTPTTPGAAGSSDVPEDRPSTAGPSAAPSHPTHPSHPAQPARPTHPTHPSHPVHPSPSAHHTHPTHPAHHSKHQGGAQHPRPR